MKLASEVLAWIDLAESGEMPDHLPARPISRWIEAEAAKLRANPHVDSAEGTLARRLGIPERDVWRLRRMVRATSRDGRRGDFPSLTFTRDRIERALAQTAVGLWELYPGVDDDVADDVHEGWCDCCAERVLTDAAGRCLWCDTPTTPRQAPKADRVVHARKVAQGDVVEIPRFHVERSCTRCGGTFAAANNYARRCPTCREERNR